MQLKQLTMITLNPSKLNLSKFHLKTVFLIVGITRTIFLPEKVIAMIIERIITTIGKITKIKLITLIENVVILETINIKMQALMVNF